MYNKMWTNNVKNDSYIAFRTIINLNKNSVVKLNWICSAVGQLFVDGKNVAEGPYRFNESFPQYETVILELDKGKHSLGAIVNHIGIDTRIIKAYNPFFTCEVFVDEININCQWKCLTLEGYKGEVARINPQLGYIEYCNLNLIPENMFLWDFDDSAWKRVTSRQWDFGELKPIDIDRVNSIVHIPALIKEGTYAERFGYEFDDISAKITLRQLDNDEYLPQGVYFRYDLGKVMLSRMRIEIEAKENTEVDVVYSELMYDGRVTPYISLSAGTSCNMDHYILRKGKQVLYPVSPRGGRFIDIYINCKKEDILKFSVTDIERTYYNETQADFVCSDETLNKEWKIGVETLRSCSEDAVVDNPTRERGEWTGDVMDVALQIGAVSYSDVRLMRRGLVHSAQCADNEGLIAGLVPGGVAYLSTYALQWVNACYRYYVTTGDKEFLIEMWDYAVKNAHYFIKRLSEKGVSRDIAWQFVDWGYKTNDGESDMATNLHFLSALRYMIKWSKVIDREKEADFCIDAEKILINAIRKYLDDCNYNFVKIGLHRSVLSLKEGFFNKEQQRKCVEYIKTHYENSFPNNLDAPRLWSPAETGNQIITPYFSHYVFPILISYGEMEFVMKQFHTCWTYLMEHDRTTWCETFDPRWTHCHQWAGCPTWILSRYCSGLFNRFDLGKNTYEFNIVPDKLEFVKGRIPITNSDKWIEFEWKNIDGKINYSLTSQEEIKIIKDNKTIFVKAGQELNFVI